MAKLFIVALVVLLGVGNLHANITTKDHLALLCLHGRLRILRLLPQGMGG